MNLNIFLSGYGNGEAHLICDNLDAGRLLQLFPFKRVLFIQTWRERETETETHRQTRHRQTEIRRDSLGVRGERETD